MSDSPAPAPAPPASRTRKPAKPKSAAELEAEALALAIESGSGTASSAPASSVPSSKCAVTRCKERASVIGKCQHCQRSYCGSHRLPEIHSPDTCGAIARSTSQAQHRAQATWAVETEKRAPGSANKPGASLEKDREDARKRLKEKVAEMERERGGSAGKGKGKSK